MGKKSRTKGNAISLGSNSAGGIGGSRRAEGGSLDLDSDSKTQPPSQAEQLEAATGGIVATRGGRSNGSSNLIERPPVKTKFDGVDMNATKTNELNTAADSITTTGSDSLKQLASKKNLFQKFALYNLAVCKKRPGMCKGAFAAIGGAAGLAIYASVNGYKFPAEALGKFAKESVELGTDVLKEGVKGVGEAAGELGTGFLAGLGINPKHMSMGSAGLLLCCVMCFCCVALIGIGGFTMTKM